MDAHETARRWRVGQVTDSDYPVFDRLFQESFGHQMSEAEWRWKYADHPGQSLFVFNGTQAIAHYGSVTQRVLMFGEPTLALQPVDVLVSPSERGVLTRRGPMFLAATTLFETLCGPERKHRLLMGFPTTRHLVLAERLGLFESSGRLLELGWVPAAMPSDRGTRIIEIEQLTAAQVDRLAARLWKRMAADFREAIITVRDARWLRHRFLLHPTKPYRVVLVRSRVLRRPMGIMILREESGRCEWVDFIAPLRSIPALVQVGRHLAAQSGATSFYTWVAEGFEHHFSDTEPTSARTDIHNVSMTWVEAPPTSMIKDRWWLMAGDTDFR